MDQSSVTYDEIEFVTDTTEPPVFNQEHYGHD